MNKQKKIFLSIIILIIAFWIFIYPLLSVNMATGSWGGRDYRQRYHIVTNNQIYQETNVGTRDGKIGDGYDAVGILPNVFFAQINIVTGTIGYKEGLRLLHILQIGPLLLFPMFGLLIYRNFEKLEKGPKADKSFAKRIAIILVSIFPLASAMPYAPISGTSGNNITPALLLMIIYLIFRIKNNKLFLLLFLIIPVYYNFWHTWSYYFALFSLAFLVSSVLLIKNKRLFYLSVFSFVSYFLFSIFYYKQLLNLPLRSLISVLFFNRHMTEMFDTPRILGYHTGGNFYSTIQIINSLLILLVLMIVAFYIIKKYLFRDELEYHEKVIITLGIGTIIILLGLFLQGGFGRVLGRGLEVAIPILVLCFGFLLTRRYFYILHIKKKIKIDSKKILVILIVIVLLAAFSHNNRLGPHRSEINEHEEYTGKFIGGYTEDNNMFFSDFRIITSLIRYNKSFLFSIDTRQVDNPIEFLEIYYNYTDSSKQLDQYIPHDEYYVITSEKQSEWGILTSKTERLKPARENFQNNFVEDPNFSLVYSNEGAKVFYRN